MTEKLFTGTLNHNQNKTKQTCYQRITVDEVGVDEMGVDKMGRRRSGNIPSIQLYFFNTDFT